MIAEPGRFYVASAFTLATSIHSKRSVRGDESSSGAITHNMYYINDGVYGSFNCLLYDHQHVTPLPLKVSCFSQRRCESNDRIFFRRATLTTNIAYAVRMDAESWFHQASGVQRATDWTKLSRIFCCMTWNLAIGFFSKTWAPTHCPLLRLSMDFQYLRCMLLLMKASGKKTTYYSM